jgi:hypothetical protein
MKSKLRNWLTTHLSTAVGFKSHNFFTIDDFPYNAAFETWRVETKQRCDTE